jgi:hypothetical protein
MRIAIGMGMGVSIGRSREVELGVEGVMGIVCDEAGGSAVASTPRLMGNP